MIDSDKTISSILKDLTNVNENLLSLSDDIWNSIEHNDTEKLEEGVQFKKEFNRLLKTFEENSTEIATLISQFTGVKAETEIGITTEDSEENKRLIKELDKKVPHNITEDFTYKQPYAFVLNGCAYVNQNSWCELYVNFTRVLFNENKEVFYNLADNPKFYSSKGKVYFSRSANNIDKIDRVKKVADDFYIATLFSSNDLAKKMIELLQYNKKNLDDIKIYLKKDRNA